MLVLAREPHRAELHLCVRLATREKNLPPWKLVSLQRALHEFRSNEEDVPMDTDGPFIVIPE